MYYIDGCSLTLGYLDRLDNTFKQSFAHYLNKKKVCYGYQGKDNHSMLIDFFKLDPCEWEHVIIYWTYPDRHALNDIDDKGLVRTPNKNIAGPLINDGNEQFYAAQVRETAIYIYLLQTVLKERNLPYTFLTCTPQMHFEDYALSIYKDIDQSRILNWTDRHFRRYDWRTEYWMYSLPVLYGTYFDCLGWDLAHLTQSGDKQFALWIEESINNNTKEVPDWKDTDVFNWTINHTKSGVGVIHPSMDTGYSRTKELAKSVSTFIYEE